MKIKKMSIDIRRYLFSLDFNRKFQNAPSYKSKLNGLSVEKVCYGCVVLPVCSNSLDCPDYLEKVLPKVKKYACEQKRKMGKRGKLW